MDLISLTPWDLAISAALVVATALLAAGLRLGLSRQLLIAALRTAVQLSVVGLVLKALFDHPRPLWVALAALVMLFTAGVEIHRRQKRSFRGRWGFGMGALPLALSSFTVTTLTLTVVIDLHTWYDPQYAVPLLGMLLGNAMSGIAIGLDRLTQAAWDRRTIIEARLALGQTAAEAVSDLRRDAVRSGMIPIVNSMSVVGIVSLPGMMTGQILSGTLPLEAVKYQILIMFSIGACTGFGAIGAVWMGARRLFDERHRLRLDRLRSVEE